MRFVLVVATLVGGVPFLLGQPPGNSSTAQEGQLLPSPFRVYAVTGSRPQFMHDFVTERGLRPTVAVFALQVPPNPQAPLAVLLQKLNAAVAAHQGAQLGAFAVFLTLERDFYEDPQRIRRVAELEGLNKQLGLTALPLGLAHADAAPVKQYAIVTRDDPVNMVRKHQVTVLVYDKHRVVKRFTFTEDKPLTEDGIQQIFAAVEKMLGVNKP
jgi:hypothetical protein